MNYAILSKKFNDVGRLVSMTQHPSHSFCGRLVSITTTTLQSMMNAKLSLQGFRHCHENGLIKTIETIPHNL